MRNTKYDAIWYLKWFSTILLLLSVAVRSEPWIDRLWDVVLGAGGSVGWLIVSIAWRDRAMIILNTLMTFLLIKALFAYL